MSRELTNEEAAVAWELCYRVRLHDVREAPCPACRADIVRLVDAPPAAALSGESPAFFPATPNVDVAAWLREMADGCEGEPNNAAWNLNEAARRLALPRAENNEEAVEQLASEIHAVYENEALRVGWQTQTQSRVPWPEVPPANQSATRAVARYVLASLRLSSHAPLPEVREEDVEWLRSQKPNKVYEADAVRWAWENRVDSILAVLEAIRARQGGQHG